LSLGRKLVCESGRLEFSQKPNVFETQQKTCDGRRMIAMSVVRQDATLILCQIRIVWARNKALHKVEEPKNQALFTHE